MSLLRWQPCHPEIGHPLVTPIMASFWPYMCIAQEIQIKPRVQEANWQITAGIRHIYLLLLDTASEWVDSGYVSIVGFIQNHTISWEDLWVWEKGSGTSQCGPSTLCVPCSVLISPFFFSLLLLCVFKWFHKPRNLSILIWPVSFSVPWPLG